MQAPAAAERPAETAAAASPWKFVIKVWLISRIFFLLVGAVGAATVEDANPFPQWHPFPGHLAYWASWDGGWYERIARYGYEDRTSTAWFPGYPVTIRAGTALGLSPAAAGVLISLGAFLIGLYFFFALARDVLDDERKARMATVALAFFPMALYFNALYTESLFLALSAGAIWAARIRRNLLLAVILGYFAAVTRNLGVFIVIPLAWELARDEEGGWDWQRLAPVLTIPLALAAFMVFLFRVSSDPLLFSTVQTEVFLREPTLPTTALIEAFPAALDGVHWLVHPVAVFHDISASRSFDLSKPFNLAYGVLALVLLGAGYVRLPRHLWAYCLVLVAVPMAAAGQGNPLISMPRYLLSAFPLFFVLGDWLSESRGRAAVWLAGSAGLGAYSTLLFVSWRFAG